MSALVNQMSYFQREFGENDSYNLVQLYADCGRSGTSLNRPAFDKMIADAGVDKNHTDKAHEPFCAKCQRRYAFENAA